MADPRPDLRAGPPPRFRVVERDRRLVVIESGAPTRGSHAPIPAEARWFPRQISFDGSAAVTTRGWYDAAAPRTLRLDPGSARTVRIGVGLSALIFAGLVAVMIAEPLLIIPIAVLLGKVRKPARAAITRWLDEVARTGS